MNDVAFGENLTVLCFYYSAMALIIQFIFFFCPWRCFVLYCYQTRVSIAFCFSCFLFFHLFLAFHSPLQTGWNHGNNLFPLPMSFLIPLMKTKHLSIIKESQEYVQRKYNLQKKGECNLKEWAREIFFIEETRNGDDISFPPNWNLSTYGWL